MSQEYIRIIPGLERTNEPYRTAFEESGRRQLALVPGRHNVSVRFRLNGRSANLRLSGAVRDLFDLAACVYIADEVSPRQESPDRWRREFGLMVPVRSVDLWQSVRRDLSSTLEFLSGDRWTIRWAERARLSSYGRHRRSVPRGCDAVCLFSGGMDSLIGAAALLEAGRRVLLVGHHADGVTGAAQKRMLRGLGRRFGDAVQFVDCLVAQRRGAGRNLGKGERTHRTRSFLFLSAAAAVAAHTGSREIFIPENGLIALNSPLTGSRLGALSTRTAHPRFLTGFADLLGQILGEQYLVLNPLCLQSKTEALRAAPRWVQELALDSVSCSHDRMRWVPGAGSDIRHCGYCVPCIYRRAAFIDVGLDDAGHYYRDVFTRLASLSVTESSDIRALCHWARTVRTLSRAGLETVVLAHGTFDRLPMVDTEPRGIRDLGEMLQRWATEFMTMLEARCSQATKRVLRI